MELNDFGICNVLFLLKEEIYCISRFSFLEIVSIILDRIRGINFLEIVNI